MPTVLDYIRTASPSSEGHLIKASDWGVLPPGTIGTAFTAGGNLTNVGSGGSLATSTGAFKITFMTANGETAASAEATVSVTGGPSGSVTVSITNQTLNTSTQLNAAPIIGWNIYSGNGSGNELLNNVQASLSATLSSQVLPNGTTVTFIPIATTSATVKIYGTGQAPPTLNLSGIQQPLPNISANSSADIFLVVKRTFQVQKMVSWIRPNSSADAAGIAPALMDCVGPLWASGTSFSAGAVILVNRVVFIAQVGGTSAGSIPAGLTTRPAKYTTVVDNSVTWLSLGEAAIVRSRFVNMTGSAGQPLAQEYDLVQE